MIFFKLNNSRKPNYETSILQLPVIYYVYFTESLQNTLPGKKLNLISSTRPDGGHSTDSNDSVASTEIQPVGTSAYDEGENDVSMGE